MYDWKSREKGFGNAALWRTPTCAGQGGHEDLTVRVMWAAPVCAQQHTRSVTAGLAVLGPELGTTGAAIAEALPKHRRSASASSSNDGTVGEPAPTGAAADELLIPKSEGVYSFLMSFMSAAKPPKSAGGSSPYG